MNNNLISLSLSGSKTSSLSETSKVANNIINLNLSNVNNVSSLESNFQSNLQSNLVELQLTEKEYTFEELMEYAEKKLEDMKQTEISKKTAMSVEKIINNISDYIYKKDADGFYCIDENELFKIENAMNLYNCVSEDIKKYISEEAKEKLKKSYDVYERIQKHSNDTFKGFTDFQYNVLANVAGRFNVSKYSCDFNVGDNLGYMGGSYTNLSGLEVVENVQGIDGFSALVLKDSSGEYTIVYPSTGGTIENYLYDAYPLLVNLGVYYMLGDLPIESLMQLLSTYANFPPEILDKFKDYRSTSQILEYIKNIYYNQKQQAANLAAKYYGLSKTQNVELNFFGHSKGGGMAEFAYLYCLDNFKNNDVLGEVVIYNPYHDNLDKSQVNKLKQTDDLTVYRNQGDFVSMLFNESDFDDETIFLKTDWETMYGDTNWCISMDDNYLDLGLISVVANFDGVTKIFDAGPHGADSAVSSGAYDENGNAIPAEKVNYRDISIKLFGTEDVIETARQTVPALGYIALSTTCTSELFYYTPLRIAYDGVERYDNVSEFKEQFKSDGKLYGEKLYESWNDYTDMLNKYVNWDDENFLVSLGKAGGVTVQGLADVTVDTLDYGLNFIDTGVDAVYTGVCETWDGMCWIGNEIKDAFCDLF